MELVDILTIIGVCIVATASIVASGLAWIFKCISNLETKLHARSNGNKDRIHDVELKLANDYASKQNLEDVKNEILVHIDEKFEHLTQIMKLSTGKKE